MASRTGVSPERDVNSAALDLVSRVAKGEGDRVGGLTWLCDWGTQG